MSEALQILAEQVQSISLELGASEVSVGISRSVSTELGQREGVIEKCQQSGSLSIGVELLVNDRFSSHSSCDTRPDQLRSFLQRAIDATRYLEEDPHPR